MSNHHTASVFKITGSVKDEFGTGFLIHKDSEYSYFLTCDHVIQDVGGKRLKINNFPAKIYCQNKNQDFDIAVLRVKEIFDELPLVLDLKALNHQTKQLNGIGFRNEGSQSIIETFECDIDQEVEITSNLGEIREKAWRVKTNSKTSLVHGFSGSPIINSNGFVIGFLNQKKGGNHGFVISIITLKHIWIDNFPFGNDAVENRVNKKDISLVNFISEVNFLNKILSKREKDTRLIAAKGKRGIGKSRLFREYLRLIENSGHKIKFIDFKKNYINAEDILDLIASDLGLIDYSDFVLEQRPHNLSREMEKQWHKKLNQKFFSILYTAKIESPYFLIIDHYEYAQKELEEWFSKYFLEKNTTDSNIIIIVGGIKIPSVSYIEKHRQSFEITHIPIEDYYQYFEDNNISIDLDRFKFAHNLSNGSPSLLIPFIQKEQHG